MTEDKKIGRERPLSPHLQVYKPQITSILSITHRATGVALYIGAFVLVYYIYAFAFLQQSVFTWLFSSSIGKVFAYMCLLGWSFAVYYHTCNGIRHLFWDIGKGYEIKTAYKTGYAVLIASVSLTLITWIYLLV